jgi:hypothetical protein
MNFHMSALLSLSASVLQVEGRYASQLPRYEAQQFTEKSAFCEGLVGRRQDWVRKN